MVDKVTSMIDLKATYGDTYRITLDESAKVGGVPRDELLWLYRIPAKYGHVYVHGQDVLGAYCDRKNIIPRLKRLPGVRVHQQGDREVTVVFAPEHFPSVADLLQARKRRILSDEQKAIQVARVAEFNRKRWGTQPKAPEIGKTGAVPVLDASAERGMVDPSSEVADRS
jgi:hypothetical protein